MAAGNWERLAVQAAALSASPAQPAQSATDVA